MNSFVHDFMTGATKAFKEVGKRSGEMGYVLLGRPGSGR